MKSAQMGSARAPAFLAIGAGSSSPTHTDHERGGEADEPCVVTIVGGARLAARWNDRARARCRCAIEHVAHQRHHLVRPSRPIRRSVASSCFHTSTPCASLTVSGSCGRTA